jgi:hypothetical protein
MDWDDLFHGLGRPVSWNDTTRVMDWDDLYHGLGQPVMDWDDLFH